MILNACYSEALAHMISEYVEFVVGIPEAISTSHATMFARSFYEALGFGKSFGEAYEIARLRLQLDEASESELPVLFSEGPSKRSLPPMDANKLDDVSSPWPSWAVVASVLIIAIIIVSGFFVSREADVQVEREAGSMTE
ncbi:MAG: hypothetical protein HC888_08160 [Candidatus Competibacteraceae bacterium]|nr:hypothetical protein [Candidatus Competibacteraceae bacterium]